MKKTISLFFLIIFTSQLHAETDYKAELDIAIGISNVSFTENKSRVVSNTIAPAQSGSISVISMDLKYKFLPSNKLDYFVRLSAPLLTDGGDAYFSVMGGFNYYFGDQQGSGSQYEHKGSVLAVSPGFRYFAGVEIGVGYVIYSNELVRRNDVPFNIGAHAGFLYNFSFAWSAKVSAHFARGAGSQTTTTAIQGFAGASYSF